MNDSCIREENKGTGDNVEEQINRLTSRHIARLLDRLGETIAPIIQQEIKKEFWFLADDIKQENKGDTNGYVSL